MDDNRQPRTQGNSTFQERRKKSDWVIKMSTILSGVSWFIAIAALFVLDQARPERHNMFTRMFDVAIRDYWDSAILPIVLTLLFCSLGSCVFAFIFNMLRMRRKTDKYKKSIIVIGVITIIGIVFFLIQFVI